MKIQIVLSAADCYSIIVHYFVFRLIALHI